VSSVTAKVGSGPSTFVPNMRPKAGEVSDSVVCAISMNVRSWAKRSSEAVESR